MEKEGRENEREPARKRLRRIEWVRSKRERRSDMCFGSVRVSEEEEDVERDALKAWSDMPSGYSVAGGVDRVDDEPCPVTDALSTSLTAAYVVTTIFLTHPARIA